MKCLLVLAAFALSAAAAPSVERRAQLDSSFSDAITTSGTHLPSSNNVLTQKRATIKNDCPGKEKFISQALADCASKARGAQQAARNGSSEIFNHFFKKDDNETRNEVASLMGKIVDECEAKDAGFTTISCVDQTNDCKKDINAYAKDSSVVLCDPFFQLNRDGDGPGDVQKGAGNPKPACGGQDSGIVILHEISHALGKTEDFKDPTGAGGYGLEFVEGLDAQKNIKHADTYSLFARAISLNCSKQELQQAASREVPSGGSTRPFIGDSNDISEPQSGTGPNQASPSNGRPQAPGQENIPQARPPVPGQKSPARQPAVPGKESPARQDEGKSGGPTPPFTGDSNDIFEPQSGTGPNQASPSSGLPQAPGQVNIPQVRPPVPGKESPVGQPAVPGDAAGQGNTVDSFQDQNSVDGPPVVQGNTAGPPSVSNGPPSVQGNTVNQPPASVQENTVQPPASIQDSPGGPDSI